MQKKNQNLHCKICKCFFFLIHLFVILVIKKLFLQLLNKKIEYFWLFWKFSVLKSFLIGSIVLVVKWFKNFYFCKIVIFRQKFSKFILTNSSGLLSKYAFSARHQSKIFFHFMSYVALSNALDRRLEIILNWNLGKNDFFFGNFCLKKFWQVGQNVGNISQIVIFKPFCSQNDFLWKKFCTACIESFKMIQKIHFRG